MRFSRALQPIATAAWAARHPVLAAKHMALNFTRAGDPVSLDELAARLSSGGHTRSGRHVTSESLLRVSAANRALRLIAETAGALPLRLMRRTGDVPEPATDHPLYRRLARQPNAFQTSSSFVEQLVTALVLYEQAYIVADGFGSRRALYAVTPLAVQRKIFAGEQRQQFHMNVGGRTRVLDPGDIVPIDGFRMPGALEGMALAGMFSEAFSLAMAAEEYGASFFSSGGRPTGVLTSDNVLRPEQRAQLRESFKGLMRGRGIDGMGELTVLEAGLKYQSISTSPEDSQFLATRKYAVLEMARVFGVPPHMLGELDRATYANAEANRIEFLTFTLMTRLERIEKSIGIFLLSEAEQDEYFVKFSIEGLLRADSRSRAEFYRIMVMTGLMTQNEVRRLEDLPRVEGADELLVPMNMTPHDLLAGVAAGAQDGGT